jgi:hypothetical protein
MIQFLTNLALFLVKNANFWRKYFKNLNIGPWRQVLETNLPNFHGLKRRVARFFLARTPKRKNIPNDQTNANKYVFQLITKILNGHELTNIINFKAFRNIPKYTFLVRKYAIWQPWDRCYDFLNIFAENFCEKIGVFDSKQS